MSGPHEPTLPPTPANSLEWVRAASRQPRSVRPFPHPEFEADEIAGGYAFVDDTSLFVVCRNGSWGIGLLDAGGSPRERIDDWLVRNRHAARELPWDELGPWQRAAVNAVRAGVTVAELPAADRAGLGTDVDRDHADWIWIALDRRSRLDPLRALAANDSLLVAPAPPGRHGRRTHPCPLCGRPSTHAERYPRSVCDRCHGRAADSAGRLVRGNNLSISGGFEARYAVPHPTPDGGRHADPDAVVGEVCEEVTRSGLCWVDGHACSIGEARFGGVVVQALPMSPNP